MPDYSREWARFADWCESAGRVAMPATEETVLAYLAEESPTGGTAARWVASIRARHRAAGVSDPCLGAVKALLRTARRGGGTDAAAVLSDAGKRVGPIAQLGWPNGVFGRRDRFAFLLSRIGAMSVPEMLALRTDDVAVTRPGRVEITSGEDVIGLQSSESSPPVACPACAALRWGWALRHADMYATRELAAKLTSEPLSDAHICLRESVVERRWAPGGWPVFPSLDRWGAFPAKPAPSMSVRYLEDVLRRVERGETARTSVRLPGVPAGHRPAPQQPVLVQQEALAPSSEDLKRWHEEGVASRMRAKADLAEIDDDYDQLDEEMSELNARIQALLDEATGE